MPEFSPNWSSIHVWSILSSMSGPAYTICDQHIPRFGIYVLLIKIYYPSVVRVILQVILHIHEGSRISEPCTTRGSAQYIRYIKYNYSSHNLNLHQTKTLYFYRIQRSWLTYSSTGLRTHIRLCPWCTVIVI